MRAVAIFASCVLLGACASSSKHAENAPTTTVPGAVACTPLGDSEHADQTMNVAVTEWKIEAPAENIAKTPNGAIDEAKLPDGAVLGAVNVPVGGSCDLTVRLTPGPYTLACNLVEAMDMNNVHAHFAKGMHVELDVSS